MSFFMPIWEYFINFLEILFFFFFINMKLDLQKQIHYVYYKQFFYFLFQFFVVSLLNIIHANSMISLIVCCILEIFYSIIFFKNSTSIKLLCGITYSLFCVLSELLTTYFLQIFYPISKSQLQYNGTLRILSTILYIITIGIFVFLFHNINIKNILFSPLQIFFSIFVSLIGILMTHYILLLTLNTTYHFHNFTPHLIFINFIFMLILLILIFYIYLLGRSQNQILKLLNQNHLEKLEEHEYKALLEKNSSLNKMKHDINIHLDVIETLAKQQKNSDLLHYIETFHTSITQDSPLISTGNLAIDSIISHKLALCAQLNIQTDYQIMIPTIFPLNSVTLSSLLGNLWSNAIEACQRSQKDNSGSSFYIKFYMKPFKNMILIHIENNYCGTVHKTSSNTFLSSKKEKYHGIGLNRIKDIIQNSEGVISIDTSHNIFSVHIMIPIGEISNDTTNSNY